MTPYHALPTLRLEAEIDLAQAEPWIHAPITRDSPVLDVMTDLTQIRAATIHSSMSLIQAEQSMIYQEVHLLFVVIHSPAIAGLITSTDMRGVKPMQVVHARKVRYGELTVADVMTRLDMLDAIDYGRLHSATVGDAIATLKRFGRNHLLVVEKASSETPRRVRGLISLSQIEQQLGEKIELTPIASSFSEIEQALF